MTDNDDEEEDMQLGFVNFNGRHPNAFRKFTKHKGVSPIKLILGY